MSSDRATESFSNQRENMIRSQLKNRGIHDRKTLEAMGKIPRELFLPEDKKNQAYMDSALQIGLGQTISQPYIVALMTEALELKPENKVLEAGTGSGYQTAILGSLCRWVYTLEKLEPLSRRSSQCLRLLGIENVTFLTGDGSRGFSKEAPYDAIIVTAAAPKTPESLCEQLAEGGRLVIPVGDRKRQVLYQIRRRGDDFYRRRLCDCVFVPLLGMEGFPEED